MLKPFGGLNRSGGVLLPVLRKRFVLAMAGLGVCWVMCGCVDVEGIRKFEHEKFRIMDGVPDESGKFSAVVAIAVRLENEIYPYCSGVLVQDDKVLTAAHCLKDQDNFPVSQFYGEGRLVIFGGQGAFHDVHGIARIQIHPGYRPQTSKHDIALITLEAPLGEAPFLAAGRDDGVATFARIVFAGYGRDEEGETGKLKYVSGFVDRYCPLTQESCRIDDASIGDILLPGGSMIHWIEKGGPCLGDSGGPVLIERQGLYEVLGIVSHGDRDCSQFVISTSVADHAMWLDNALSEGQGSDCQAMPMSKPSSGVGGWIFWCIGCILWFYLKKHKEAVSRKS